MIDKIVAGLFSAGQIFSSQAHSPQNPTIQLLPSWEISLNIQNLLS